MAGRKAVAIGATERAPPPDLAFPPTPAGEPGALGAGHSAGSRFEIVPQSELCEIALTEYAHDPRTNEYGAALFFSAPMLHADRYVLAFGTPT